MGGMGNYPDLVRKAFEITLGTQILFGIAYGYEDSIVAGNDTWVGRDEISTRIIITSE